MRIWIINHYAIPPTCNGGTRHYNYAQELKKLGHEVLLIAANYSHFSHEYISQDAVVGKVDSTHNVDFVWIPVPAYKGNTVSRFWNMLVFAYRILLKKYLPCVTPPDIIIGSSPHLFAALSALILAKRKRIPFVLEIRDLWPETLVDLGRLSYKHPLVILMTWIEKYLYKHARKIITLLPGSINYLTKCGVNPNDIIWLPNAVDLNVIPTIAKPPHEQFTFIYSGSHGVANDLDTLLEAAKILTADGYSHVMRIYLIGDGPDKVNLQKKVQQENISMVEFLASVSKKEVYSILAKADSFLMLLKNSPVFRWGISPNKLFDYLAMARPVIFAVNTPFNPVELAGAGITIPSSDAQALAQAMLQIYHLSPDERKILGEKGYAYVSKNHDILQLAQKLDDVLVELINSTGSQTVESV